ncbi:unnamed protein product [Aphanomyces euteiches]
MLFKLAATWAVVAAQAGVFYAPEHNPTLNSTNTTQLAAAIDADFALIQTYYTVIRTAQASYFGVPIAPIAKKYGLGLYLGVDGSPSSLDEQVAAAVSAIQSFPGTVRAVLVGCDALEPFGALNVSSLVSRISTVKSCIQTVSRSVPIGTSQRVEAWLNANTSSLAAAVDVVGVQIYPYLNPAYSSAAPLALLESAWTNLSARFPAEKLLVTETGFPTATDRQPSTNPALSVANATRYFVAFSQSKYAGIWASFFDKSTTSSRYGMPESQFFGLYTATGSNKYILPSVNLESAKLSFFTPGVCYSPFHAQEYPLNGGSAANLPIALDADFKLLAQYFSVVRTYYSSYMGYDVASYAAKYNVQLFLGVYMTREAWNSTQETAAITAAIKYPNTIAAILVGNENVAPFGPFAASLIVERINFIRNQIRQATGRNVAVGTVQRATEWLNPAMQADMQYIAANSDIIGVNIYPFFDNGYQSSNPLALLHAIWNQMLALYPASKLRLTETGFSTGGAPSSIAPRNKPTLANAMQFYNAFQTWIPKAGGGEAFWYTMFDLRADDRTQPEELEKYFGFFTANREPKAINFPLVRQLTPPPTPPPPPPTPPPPSPPTTPALLGVLYSPFHADEYPNDVKNLGAAIALDLLVIRSRFSTIRTAYANFYGVDIMPYAAAAGFQVYLGVGMTRESWFPDQIASAISAVRYFPSSVQALLVGCENAYVGDYFSAGDILNAMNSLRSQIQSQTGRTAVRMGTVQRISEWLNPALRSNMVALANACDVIGVTVSLYDSDNLSSPAAAVLDKWWSQLTAIYPASKLHLMDVGYPTQGPSAAAATGNRPSVAQAQAFYDAVRAWQTSRSASTWFASFYDDKPTTPNAEFTGFFTAQRQPKASNYPLATSS